MKYTKKSTLKQVLKNHKNAEQILMGFGMHCFYCPHAQQESLEEACLVHDIDLDLLLEKLNENP